MAEGVISYLNSGAYHHGCHKFMAVGLRLFVCSIASISVVWADEAGGFLKRTSVLCWRCNASLATARSLQSRGIISSLIRKTACCTRNQERRRLFPVNLM